VSIALHPHAYASSFPGVLYLGTISSIAQLMCN
jgi:hypothetical protein